MKKQAPSGTNGAGSASIPPRQQEHLDNIADGKIDHGDLSRWKTRYEQLVASTVETWAHQLLYTCRVYPRTSFANVNFLGVRCRINRHPDVVKYITNAVHVIAPAIVSGISHDVDLNILCQGKEKTAGDQDSGQLVSQERYRFSIPPFEEKEFRTSINGVEISEIEEMFEGLERIMRDMILQIHSIAAYRQNAHGSVPELPTTTFRLELRIAQHVNGSYPPCQALDHAVASGKWFEPEPTASLSSEQLTDTIVPLRQTETLFGLVEFVRIRSRGNQS